MATENQLNESVPEEQVSPAEDVNPIPPAAEPAAEEPEKEAALSAEPETGEVAGAVCAEEPRPARARTTAAKVAEAKVVQENGDGEAPEPLRRRPVKTAAALAELVEGVVEAKVHSAGDVQTGTASEEEDGPITTTVDFSDEEARLAAEAPEFDLGEENPEQEEAEPAEAASGADYSGMGKDELLKAFAGLLESRPVQTLRKDAEAIKIAFYKIHRTEVEALRKAFLESGGVPEDFAAPADGAEQRLKELFLEYRRKRDEFVATIEQKKEENLKAKLQIIEELKELVNSNETLNHTFTAFRELQQRWREIGPVPQAQVKDLWETYNLHVENFYNFIKINKELRDLDLKKNYEAKIRLCEEAEALVLEPSVINAFHKLQKLHEQWRETGPVANEFKESLWERFKEASSRINKQHQEYFERLKEEQKRNFDLKTELCVKTEELAASPLTTRKEWNKASDQLIEIQKVWKTIGYAPKKENSRVYERFRTACDRFFEQKRNFYLQIKAEMEHNLQLKNEICEAAEALKESTEWKKTTDELIGLQKKWKEIGPVSRRHSDAVWKRFRAACDYFFDRKQSHFSTLDAEHDDNLKRKQELLAEIEAFDVSGITFDAIKEFQRRWSEIGFVPIKQKDAIQKRYKEAVDVLFNALRGGEKDRQMDRFRGKVASMKGAGDKRLRFERDRLYNKVKQLEADIALLENNIGFFSRSKNAEAMIREVEHKIERAKEEMAAAIEKIHLIDSQDNEETK